MGDFKDSIYGNNPETRSFIDNLYGSGNKDYSAGADTANEYEFVSSYEEKPHKKKKKKMSKNGKIALLVCISIILSGAFGFAGAAVYNGVFDGSQGGGNSISRTDGYTLEDATGSSLTVSEIVEKSADSVVEIVTESVATDSWMMQYITEGAGSGVIIDSDGYIMTNNHVISGARKITVTLRNGDEYEAKLAASDEEAGNIIRAAKERANAESRNIISAADRKAAAMLKKADEDIAFEKKKAINDVKNEISGISVEIAEKMIGRELKEEDHRALIDSYIDGIGK